MAQTVVVLGGSYAGVHVAHHVLKNTTNDVRVVLVSRNSHFYWNMAAVRAIIPDTFSDSQLLAPLADCFAHYPPGRVEVVIGTVDRVDTDARTVAVVSGGGQQTFTYDQLVLATGARSSAPEGAATAATPVPWKADGTYEDLVALLAETRRKVAAAQHIVVAGGGLTGSEVAADLAAAYAKKKTTTTTTKEDTERKTIVLLTAGTTLLGGDSLAGGAMSALKGLGVDVRTGQKVTGVTVRPDGKTELTLDGGGGATTTTTTLLTDLYLPALGQTPNSAYLDKALLTPAGYVRIDDAFRAATLDNVWALGDIVSKPRAAWVYTQLQAAGVGKNVVRALQGLAPTAVQLLPVDVVTMSLGPAAGMGRLGWVRMPSFVVARLKAKRLGTQMLPKYRDGSVA